MADMSRDERDKALVLAAIFEAPLRVQIWNFAGESPMPEECIDLIARALRLLAGEMGEPVAVKALEWVKHESADIWRALTFAGTYYVDTVQDNLPAWKFEPDSFSVQRVEFTDVADAEAGRAAAYAHWTALIRSALVSPPARSYAEGVEDAAKWHESEIAQLEQQIIENNEYAERRPEGVGGANAYCRDKITTHRFSIEAIRALAPKEG